MPSLTLGLRVAGALFPGSDGEGVTAGLPGNMGQRPCPGVISHTEGTG